MGLGLLLEPGLLSPALGGEGKPGHTEQINLAVFRLLLV